MRKNFSVFVVLSFVFCSFVVNAQDLKYPPIPNVSSIAHRGFSNIAPENTLIAVKKAIEVGAQGCEFDVYSTADGVLFLTHDKNLKRTTGYDCDCKSIDSTKLFTLDFGAWKGEEFRGETVATYEEVLALLKGTKTHPVIEIKENGFENKILEGIRKYDLLKESIVIDFDATRVKHIRELAPDLCVAWLCSFKTKEESPQSIANRIINTLKDCNTNVVDIEYHAISPELLKILDNAGISVMCWTVDKPNDIERLVSLGVKSITSNRPDLVLEIQKKQSSSNSKL